MFLRLEGGDAGSFFNLPAYLAFPSKFPALLAIFDVVLQKSWNVAITASLSFKSIIYAIFSKDSLHSVAIRVCFVPRNLNVAY